MSYHSNYALGAAWSMDPVNTDAVITTSTKTTTTRTPIEPAPVVVLPRRPSLALATAIKERASSGVPLTTQPVKKKPKKVPGTHVAAPVTAPAAAPRKMPVLAVVAGALALGVLVVLAKRKK